MAEQSRDSSVGDDSTDYVEDRDPKFDSPPISRSSTPETVIYDPESPAPLSRRRARSNSIRGEDANPANTPITASDQALANLIRSINSGRGPTEYRGVQSAPRFQIAGGHSPRPNRSSSGIAVSAARALPPTPRVDSVSEFPAFEPAANTDKGKGRGSYELGDSTEASKTAATEDTFQLPNLQPAASGHSSPQSSPSLRPSGVTYADPYSSTIGFRNGRIVKQAYGSGFALEPDDRDDPFENRNSSAVSSRSSALHRTTSVSNKSGGTFIEAALNRSSTPSRSRQPTCEPSNTPPPSSTNFSKPLTTHPPSNSPTALSTSTRPRVRSTAHLDAVIAAGPLVQPSPIRSSTPFMMNYQNYLESPQTAAGANPRQAPSPSQGMNHANGVNGAVLPGIIAGLPTPAGHQSDLNYLYGMVEELSRTLAENRAATDRIVNAAGRVRQRAQELDMSNDELIASVSDELNSSTKNLELENQDLRRKLEKAEYGRDENWKLCLHASKLFEKSLEQAHAFKKKTVDDMCAWHRSYRNQLAEEREENLALRGRIADMMGAAARANEWLRKAIRAYEDDPHHEKLKVRVIDYKQRARCYKRMAMPLYPDDDSEWSDDDDIIDPVYKKQLEDEIKAKNTKREEDMRRAQEEREGGVGSSLEVHTS